MKKILKISILNISFIFILLPFSLSAQYTSDLKYKEGIYFSLEQIKSNNPIPAERLSIAKYFNRRNPKNLNYLLQEILNNKAIYTDDTGNTHLIKTSDVYGICCHGDLFIKKSGYFNRVEIAGSITVYTNDNLFNGYLFNDRLKYSNYAPEQQWITVHDPISGTPLSVRKDSYDRETFKGRVLTDGDNPSYLLDLETDKSKKLNIRNLKELLKKDPLIYSEYSNLSYDLKKYMMFDYIQKFNKRNPIFISEN